VTGIAKRRLPIPGQMPEEDRLLAMVAALASELAITRERLDTVERLAESAGLFRREQIETFVPTPVQTTERDSTRRHIIARVFRALKSPEGA
jgi:hypothetical protein